LRWLRVKDHYPTLEALRQAPRKMEPANPPFQEARPRLLFPDIYIAVMEP
jgi:hypothetical protein